MEWLITMDFFKITTVAFVLLAVTSVQAESIDLSAWTAESYPAVPGFGAGTWNVSGDSSSVFQSVNGQPTFFYSDFNSQGSEFIGSIQVSGGDDDFIGFALGFNAGDSLNSAADYLLIDWKRGTQGHNFGAPSSTPGSTAFSGLAVSRVTGTPTADEFWGHFDDAPHAGGGVEELQRGSTLGATGWTAGTNYDFTFDFGPNNLQVFVDGVMELDIAGLFNDGSFAFYNFSQAGVTYSGFEENVGSFPVVPVPAAIWLFGSAIIGLVGFSRKKSVTMVTEKFATKL